MKILIYRRNNFRPIFKTRSIDPESPSPPTLSPTKSPLLTSNNDYESKGVGGGGIDGNPDDNLDPMHIAMLNARIRSISLYLAKIHQSVRRK